MAYDSAIVTYTTKTDKVDLVQAAHMNAVQNELIAIETMLGVGIRGSCADLKTRLAVCLAETGALQKGSAFPCSAIEGQMFYRTDNDALYIHNGTSFIAAGAVASAKIAFIYEAQMTVSGSDIGEYSGASLNPSAITTNTYRFLIAQGAANTYVDVLKRGFYKTPGVGTIKAKFQAWNKDTNANRSQKVKLTIGTAYGEMTGNTDNTNPQTTFADWKELTVDVSGLADNAWYEAVLSIAQLNEANYESYIGNFIAFAY